jgi:hypothetical protein
VRSAQLKPTLHGHVGFLHNGNYNLSVAAVGNGYIHRRSISVDRPAEPGGFAKGVFGAGFDVSFCILHHAET